MVTRSDLHRLVDELPDEDLSKLGELLRARAIGITRLAQVGPEPPFEPARFLEHGIDAQIEAMKRAVESGPRSITLQAFVDVLRVGPAPDEQLADDLDAIRREQGTVEPVDWSS
jgi:hypothetical protein